MLLESAGPLRKMLFSFLTKKREQPIQFLPDGFESEFKRDDRVIR